MQWQKERILEKGSATITTGRDASVRSPPETARAGRPRSIHLAHWSAGETPAPSWGYTHRVALSRDHAGKMPALPTAAVVF